MDLLDTSLSPDLAVAGDLDSAMIKRFRDLGQYAAGITGQRGQTQAILFTCSAFGPVLDAVKADHAIPVLRPNEAAFAKALTLGRRLALVVPPPLAALQNELPWPPRQVSTSTSYPSWPKEPRPPSRQATARAMTRRCCTPARA